jgi:hypothetical protein
LVSVVRWCARHGSNVQEVTAIERANFPPLTRAPRSPGPDIELEYEDGYPKLPAPLDRRQNLEKEKFLDGLRRQAMPAVPKKLRSVDGGAE